MFLGRAKKFLQDLATDSEPTAQYFNVACSWGHRIRGERTEGYQALRCPVCGDGIFVLPRSPLPDPVAPPSAIQHQRNASVSGRQIDDGPIELTDASHMAVDLGDQAALDRGIEIDWENDPVNRTKPHAKPQKRDTDDHTGRTQVPTDRRTASATTLADDHARTATAERSASQRPPDTGAIPPRQTTAARVRRTIATLTRRRNQLIFVAVPIIALAAIGWRVWNNRKQEYPLIVERGKIEGIGALEEGNFDKAYQLLSAAKSAVNALGGEIEGADEVRQAADEAALFVDQCSRSLEEMLEEAARTAPESWASNFETHYKGKAVVLDSFILAAPTPTKNQPYRIAYKVFPPGQPGNFRDGAGSRPDRVADIDFTNFELFKVDGPRPGHHVTIGARLATFQYDADRGQWIIGLEPKSGVYIQHTKALDASGWADETSESQPAELLP